MNQIKATIIADSIANGIRITTFELEYPRFIHSELMTHRQFSRNAASSRAIPIEKMNEHVLTNMATPVHWGVNQPGMQADVQLEGIFLHSAKDLWKEAAKEAVRWAKALYANRLHKQIANRVTEPFQIMKTIVTATEFDNWFNLRYHKDAQPEIKELARIMRRELDNSKPTELGAGDWHMPYVQSCYEYGEDNLCYYSGDENISLEDALKISASCCAQVSYRKNDESLEKAVFVYERLVGMEPKHASPFEHQAMVPDMTKNSWQSGFTHMDRNHNMWSGNFKGWIQHRQILGY